jgi:hypothetical protein
VAVGTQPVQEPDGHTEQILAVDRSKRGEVAQRIEQWCHLDTLHLAEDTLAGDNIEAVVGLDMDKTSSILKIPQNQKVKGEEVIQRKLQPETEVDSTQVMTAVV